MLSFEHFYHLKHGSAVVLGCSGNWGETVHRNFRILSHSTAVCIVGDIFDVL